MGGNFDSDEVQKNVRVLPYNIVKFPDQRSGVLPDGSASQAGSTPVKAANGHAHTNTQLEWIYSGVVTARRGVDRA